MKNEERSKTCTQWTSSRSIPIPHVIITIMRQSTSVDFVMPIFGRSSDHSVKGNDILRKRQKWSSSQFLQIRSSRAPVRGCSCLNLPTLWRKISKFSSVSLTSPSDLLSSPGPNYSIQLPTPSIPQFPTRLLTTMWTLTGYETSSLVCFLLGAIWPQREWHVKLWKRQRSSNTLYRVSNLQRGTGPRQRKEGGTQVKAEHKPNGTVKILFKMNSNQRKPLRA